MENKKQSSVEWLISQLQRSKDWYRVLNEINQMSSAKIDVIEQAKAMHQKEIVDAHVNGNKEYTIGGGYELIAEHYYNETFGGQDERDRSIPE
jgi:hypothetical protein